MLGFVVENFNNNNLILTNTSSHRVYFSLQKLNYNMLLATCLININLNASSFYLPYDKRVTLELLSNLWLFYANALPNDLGLVTSNHLITTVNELFNSANSSDLSSPNPLMVHYLTAFEVYHLSTNNNLFNSFIIYYFSFLSRSGDIYNLNFNVSTGYVWLGWYLNFNPFNNEFYLNIYNY